MQSEGGGEMNVKTWNYYISTNSKVIVLGDEDETMWDIKIQGEQIKQAHECDVWWIPKMYDEW